MQLSEYEWVQLRKALLMYNLDSSRITRSWLLTSVSPGGKKPIDYLAEGDYATFYGFLVRTQTRHDSRFHPLTTSSSRVHHERSLEEREAMRERLRPRAWRDDDNTSD